MTTIELVRVPETYTEARSRIAMKLVNYYHHQTYLKTCPHIQRGELAVTFCYLPEEIDPNGPLDYGTTPIDNEMQAQWCVSTQTLYEDSLINAWRIQPASIARLEDSIGVPFAIGGPNSPRIYVLTNENGLFGAASLLYPGLMRTLSMVLKSNFYIIPCSVHEVMLMYEEDMGDLRHARDIVTTINMTSVDQDEVLSDALYHYDASLDRISKVEI